MQAANSLPPPAPGLSTAHIGPRASLGTITRYRGGSYVEVKPPKGSIPGRRGGGRRGEIWEFSRASRRRLLKLLNSVDRTAAPLPYFVTLTYHNEWPEDPRDWKEQLKALHKRLKRSYGPHAAVWRLEYQRRGAPHFHLLLFLDAGQVVANLGESETVHRRRAELKLRNNIAWMWNQIVGPEDVEHLAAGTGVERVKSWRGINAYAAKYMGKLEQLQSWHQKSPGRFWGKFGGDLLPISAEEDTITEPQLVRLQRVFRRCTGVRYRTLKPLPTGERLHRGMSFFVGYGSTNRLLSWLGIIGTVPGGEEGPEHRNATRK